MKFKTFDGYILQRTARRTYPRVLWTDRDLTFQDYLGCPVEDAGDKLDGEFLRETPLQATRRDEDGREDLARIRRMKCHPYRLKAGLEKFR